MHHTAKVLLELLRGLGIVLVVLWAVATATFFLMKSIPGGPLSQDRRLPAAVEQAIRERYHLNDPLAMQYLRYLGEAATGRFGVSYSQPGRSVGEIILERSPVSAILGLSAIGLSLALAFPLGVAAAMRPGRWPDRLNAFVAAAGVSVPSFILGAVMLYFFSYKLGWFPSSGWRGPASAVLPSIALAALPTAYLARLVRSELSEVLHSEFLLTARAKGLSMPKVIVVHALRHTLSPVLAYLGPQAAAVMTGSFVIEKIFDVPGIGRYFVNAIANRDYPMIMGTTLFYTAVLVVFNLAVDLLARRLDPRLRGQG